MTAGDLREAVLARVDAIKGEVIEHVQGALSRNNDLAHEIKEFAKFKESIDKRLFDFARRIAVVEKDMKSAIAAGIPGQMQSPGIVESDKPAPAHLRVICRTTTLSMTRAGWSGSRRSFGWIARKIP